MDLASIIEPLRDVDWDDIDAVEAATGTALAQLSDDPSLISAVLDELPDRPDLLALCEHYDILDKILLYSDDAGIRLRLHVFLPGYFDRPHNHRWSYASRILRGHYRHHIFGDVDLPTDADQQLDPNELKAVHVRHEHVGSAYALHHSVVHAVVAEPFTVTLVLRGPAIKDRFLVMDRATGEAWWQYGATHEDPADALRKRMSIERVHEVTGWLRDWDLF